MNVNMLCPKVYGIFSEIEHQMGIHLCLEKRESLADRAKG